jgi:hypothetical protein
LVAIHLELNIDQKTDWLTQFNGWSVFLRGNWNTVNFITSYLPQAMFPILYAGAKFWKGIPTVRPAEMDFYSGLAEIEADTYDEPPPRNKMEAFWQWLVSNEIEGFCIGRLIVLDVRGRYLSCIVALNCLIPEPCPHEKARYIKSPFERSRENGGQI